MDAAVRRQIAAMPSTAGTFFEMIGFFFVSRPFKIYILHILHSQYLHIYIYTFFQWDNSFSSFFSFFFIFFNPFFYEQPNMKKNG